MAKTSSDLCLSDVVMKLSDISNEISTQSALIEAQNKQIEKQKIIISDQQKIIGDQQRVVSKLSDKIDKLISLVSATRVSETANSNSKQHITSDLNLSERSRRAAARANKNKNLLKNVKNQQQKKTPSQNSGPEAAAGTQDESNTHVPTGHETADQPWQDVQSRKQRSKQKHSQQRSVLIGAGAHNDELQTVEKQRHIQIWQLKPETTVENIQNFLNTIVNNDDFVVAKRTIKSTRHASFIITLPESMYDKISSPSVWPAGVRISDWFLFRPRTQRGA